MKNYFVLLAAVFIIIFFNSCNHITEPYIQPGSRDYVWTIDTIKVDPGYQINLCAIAAVSANDVWAGAWGNVPDMYMWHYDGKTWNHVANPPSGAPRGFGVVSSTDIWAGTSTGHIWHWNGSAWSDFVQITKDGYDRLFVNNFYVENANSIYAVGFYYNNSKNIGSGFILHFTNGIWSFINLPVIDSQFLQCLFDYKSKELYIVGYDLTEDRIGKVHIYNFNSIHEIYSSVHNANINKIGDEVYLDFDRKIYKYEFNEMFLWKDFSNTNYLAMAWGRNEKDFFVLTDGGYSVSHYNGTDFQKISKAYWGISGIAVLEKDVFILNVMDDNMISTIVHGKLKE